MGIRRRPGGRTPKRVEFKRGAIISAGLAVIFLFAPILAAADNVDQLQSQADSAHQKSQVLQSQVDQTAAQVQTLAGLIDSMNRQAASLQSQIDQTQAQLADLNAKMAKQRQTLDNYIRDNYYLMDVSTLEALVSSDSLSQFVDKKQYVQSIQDHIDDLLADVLTTKKSLDAANAQLQQQKADLAAQIQAKNDLLAKTQGQEANYQALLAQAQAAEARLTKTIQGMLANGPVRSQGYVRAGQVIGHEGSTGNSSGPHLHFGAYQGGQPVDPMGYINRGRFNWPLQSFTETQVFGCTGTPMEPPYGNCAHFHQGVDLAGPFGEPVQAAASGNIIINSFQGDGFGHYIVIDHGNGLWTLYGHMQ